MCLILFAHEFHPDYRLVLAANRDEFYARPALRLSYWPDEPSVLAGRDLKEMGTWLGITKTGRMSAITNHRNPAAVTPGAPTRGHLVSDFLTGTDTPYAYMEKIRDKGASYNGFNLLVGDPTDLYYYANHQGRMQRLRPGLYGLSNRFLDTPWPKVENGKARLRAILEKKGHPDVEALFAMLLDRRCPPEHLLPDTGVGLEKERMLAPLFITGDHYGTRCSSVLLVAKSGWCGFYERSFAPVDGHLTERETEKFEFLLE